MRQNDVQHIFLVGAKSLGTYGGYETFVNKLTEYHQNDKRIKYHVACKANGSGCMDVENTEGAIKTGKKTFLYHNAECFQINIPEKLGSAQAIYYDIKALDECCRIIKKQKIRHPIIYIMACRIGLFIKEYYKKIHKLGGRIFLNPDGHEYLRLCWPILVRKYWKISEQMMVKWSDLVICDSVNIKKYIDEYYNKRGIKGRNPRTTFIAYGAEIRKSKLMDNDPKLLNWYKEKGLIAGKYYLAVGRFVPENNYEIMIREFMKSKSNKDFAIITNVNDKFLNELESKLGYKNDKRIKFVGTVYDQELLKKIRESAYAYFHGHEVGGTNPSLIEALGSTKLNLILKVSFNQEVALKSALYWTKENGNLARLIDKADGMSMEDRTILGLMAKERVKEAYSWEFICGRYAEEFLR